MMSNSVPNNRTDNGRVSRGLSGDGVADGVRRVPVAEGYAPSRLSGGHALGLPGGPFFLTAPDLFRRPGPPWLSSRTCARVFAETRLLGGAASTLRTPAPTETAR